MKSKKNNEFRLPDGDLARIEDAEMKAGKVRVRRISTIEEWLTRKYISKNEYGAAQQFELDYSHSKLLPRYSSMQLDRVDGSSGDAPEWKHDRAKQAYGRVQDVLALVGKRAAPALVAIIGEGQSLRSFTNGGSKQVSTKAVLQMALSIMVSHYHAKGVR
tara:strand:+ start:224 stop:703 length:480 start_codon:yes stop_codon:yes gene_type:complete